MLWTLAVILLVLWLLGLVTSYTMGLTSSDVLDTALAVQLKESADTLLEDIDRLLTVLKKRAFENKNTLMIGRSHGIHAEPITFGLKMAFWIS